MLTVEQVLSRILSIIEDKNISQKEIAYSCGITASTLSKVLNGKSGLSLELTLSLCKVLDIDPATLLTEQETALDNISFFQKMLYQRITEKDDSYHDSLLFDPNRRAFKGIINETLNPDDIYYVYLKPTISSEKTNILKGTLKFIPTETHPNICESIFKLYTGKKDRDGNEIIKTYTGQLIISLPMGSCYVILTSQKYAEINLMIFKHMFLNAENLQCRVAAIATVSAGSNRRPVMEKALISRTELSEKHISELEGQLFMSTSRIHINKSFFEASLDEIATSIFQQDCAEQINHLKNIIGNTVEYYDFDEGIISSSNEFTSSQKLKLINYLRKISDTPRYCKVSSHADEYLFNFLEENYGITNEDYL